MKASLILGILAVAALMVVKGGRAQAATATAIDVCCAWNADLADGELTFSVSGGDEATQAIVTAAIKGRE